MSDVKEMLRSALGQTRSSGGDLERAMKRAETRERTRRVFTGVVAFVVFAGAGTALWYTFRPATQVATPGPSIPASEPTPTPEVRQGWTSYSDPKLGFSVDFPSDWTRAQENLTPNLSDPHEILSLGTYPLQPGGPNCAQFPSNAIQDLGPGDAFVSIQERIPPDLSHLKDYAPRPAHFGPTDGTNGDESPGCLDGPKTFEHHWIPFTDQGRTFYAYVAMGADVSAERRAQVWEILDSLRFGPGPCDYSSVRPTYLPWVAEGAPIPTPDQVAEYNKLSWFGPSGPQWANSYVQIRLLHNSVDLPNADAAPPLPNGTQGTISSHDGNWEFYWQVSSEYCGAIGLFVSLRSLPRDEARAQAVHIAESMSDSAGVPG